MLFFLFSPENRIRHFMQIVSIRDNLYEILNQMSSVKFLHGVPSITMVLYCATRVDIISVFNINFISWVLVRSDLWSTHNICFVEQLEKKNLKTC